MKYDGKIATKKVLSKTYRYISMFSILTSFFYIKIFDFKDTDFCRQLNKCVREFHYWYRYLPSSHVLIEILISGKFEKNQAYFAFRFIPKSSRRYF